jgi:hypothetical protein
MDDDVRDGTNRLSNSISNYVQRKSGQQSASQKPEESKTASGPLNINNLPFQV